MNPESITYGTAVHHGRIGATLGQAGVNLAAVEPQATVLLRRLDDLVERLKVESSRLYSAAVRVGGDSNEAVGVKDQMPQASGTFGAMHAKLDEAERVIAGLTSLANRFETLV